MKKLIYLLILFTACKSPEKKVAVAKHDTVKKVSRADTTFILREATKDLYHAVYIERNRSSNPYKNLLGFKFDHYDSVTYNDSYKTMKIKHRAPFKKYDLGGLPQQWLPLYSYKGKYYLYSPSDFGNAGRRILTDSTIVYWSMEGPEPGPLLDFKKVTDNKYTLKAPPFYQFVKNSTINIYIIDPKNRVAVWEDTALPNDYKYGLYVPVQYARNFELVNNFCKTDKMPEFNFDKIDFKALIKGR
jgi:hypothetical protein